jgi:hypothetical protein
VEHQALEDDTALGGIGQGLGLRRRRNIRLGPQEVDQPLGGARGALQVAQHLAERAHRTGHHHGVEHEGRQLARRDLAGQHIPAADPHHRAHGAEHQHDDQGGQDRPGAHPIDRGIKGVLGPLGEARAVDRLVTEGLHGADRGERFVDVGAHVGHPVLAGPAQAAHPPAEDQNRQDHHGDHQEHQARELGAGDHQHDHPAAEQQRVAERDRRGRPDHHLEQGRVGGQARQHLARAGDLEIGRGEGDHVVEDRPADVRHHPFADPRDQIEAGVAGRRHQQHHGQEHHDRVVQQGGIAAGEALVHQGAQTDTNGQHGARRYHQSG